MKNYQILSACIFVALLLTACDNRVLDSEEFNLDEEVEIIKYQFLLPISERLTYEDIKELNKYQFIDNPTEADIADLTTYMNSSISDEEFSLLNKSVKRILEIYPEFREKRQDEIQESILMKLQVPINQKSCEAATVAAVAWIASIEATWIGAMIACAGTTIGYGLCAGLATFAKYTAIAGVLADLASACAQQE